MKSFRLQVSLPPEYKARIGRLSGMTGLTRAETIQRIIDSVCPDSRSETIALAALSLEGEEK